MIITVITVNDSLCVFIIIHTVITVNARSVCNIIQILISPPLIHFYKRKSLVSSLNPCHCTETVSRLAG